MPPPDPTSPPPRRADPVAAADDAARGLAANLLRSARHAALAMVEPGAGTPFVSRIAFGLSPEGLPMTLISALAIHHGALRADPACALLIGEPGDKGDPLTHPRLSLRARACFVARDTAERDGLRTHWLRTHPKAGLYIDFADFDLVVFDPVSAALNGGFARAWALTAADIELALNRLG